MCVELVVNREKKGQPQDVLASFRKVCSFMGKRLGLSPQDLPTLLKTKVDECCGVTEILAAFIVSFTTGIVMWKFPETRVHAIDSREP